jgi:class 3 adenylate cyclase
VPEERKLVTIVFADVTGSTAMGDELDPEDLRAFMGRYYDHARRLVQDHGRTLEKFIGDAVMAVFGLPHVHDDDAERALAAALALRESVATDELLRDRLALRIGVNTGEVMATTDRAADDFLVTGDAVNVAARLQQAAIPGQILAGERTRLAGQAGFRFGEALELDLKGKHQAVRAFAVIEPLAERRRYPEGSTRSQFVGRGRIWHSCCSSVTGRARSAVRSWFRSSRPRGRARPGSSRSSLPGSTRPTVSGWARPNVSPTGRP